jgi:D-glycero-D-manno-heptose 1,7-bisphosphate phosphatase
VIVIDGPGLIRNDLSPRRALFLDRDGVINRDAGYTHRIEDFVWIDGVRELGRAASALGFGVIIVTNQSGIGRGYYSVAQFNELSRWVMDEMAKAGVRVVRTVACPHRPEDGCSCRKPAPEMLLTAARDLRLDMGRSVLVGDKPTDIEAGRAAGVGMSILFARILPAAPGQADVVVRSLEEIVPYLEDGTRSRPIV